MLYSVTATNEQGIRGEVRLSNGKRVFTSHPLTEDNGYNPEELLALSWATCLNATIESLLSQQSAPPKSCVSVKVNLEKEPAQSGYYFNVQAYASIQDWDLAMAEALIMQAHARCPVSKLLDKASTVSLQVVPYSFHQS